MAATACASSVKRIFGPSISTVVDVPISFHCCNGTVRRWYRGESGDMKSRTQVGSNSGVDDAVARREEALLAVAIPKSEAIQTRHVRFPVLDDIPQGSLEGRSSGEGAREDKDAMELQIRKKRLIYRSKQRGWLEVDLLLGTWAAENVPSLDADALDQFESFVNMETIDIYNVLTLRTDVPFEMKREEPGASVVESIQEWARQSPLGKAEPETYRKVKEENNLI
eukprot:CAMPEP_0185731292 /NCGR_PEP_ID=MMETSP1171-20130828/12458_1 /TAXON_ID=374046 /ORGANISM="Helicotheca tamensis, Strain CCMP826" /LENGTH=223 /DNA_ID=CAMNT_0028400527 /DNA_START=110 /DNA_END=781 /DNA_ORIENTATION=-